jgi:cytochrome c5
VNQFAPGTQNLGSIYAISAKTGKIEWKYEQRASLLSLVTTGGGLLFGGDVAGRFRALDQRTGKVLWQTNLGAQVTGFPVTYSVRGKQYVAVSTGQAVNTAAYLLLTPEIRPSNNSNLYVFALPDGWQSARTTSTQSPAGATSAGTGAASAGASGSPQSPGGWDGAAPALAATPAQCRKPDAQPVASPAIALPNGQFKVVQSIEGKKIYTEQQCAICHGENMRGSASAPALADPGFRQAWQGRTLGALFDCMKASMPPGRGGSLSDNDYVHLIAAILEANGYTPGKDSSLLPDRRQLNRIQFAPAK